MIGREKYLNDFIKRVETMTNDELLTTLIYVSGLAYCQRKELNKGWHETEEDRNILKSEIKSRLLFYNPHKKPIISCKKV